MMQTEEDESAAFFGSIKHYEIAFKWQGERDHDGHPKEIFRGAFKAGWPEPGRSSVCDCRGELKQRQGEELTSTVTLCYDVSDVHAVGTKRCGHSFAGDPIDPISPH
jgi:hypothetical protein